MGNPSGFFDPVVFALNDNVSRIVVLLVIALTLLATVDLAWILTV